MAQFRDDTNARRVTRFPSYDLRAARLRFVATIGAAVITAGGLLLSSYLASRWRVPDPPRPEPDRAAARGIAATTTTAAETAPESDPAVVYVTRTGRKYHRAECQHVDGRTTFALTLDEARRRFEACRTCLPP